jgi:hypothetical protein
VLDSLLASESYSRQDILMQYYGNSSNPGVQIPFNLALVRLPKNDNIVESIDNIIKNWLIDLPENMVANWVVRVLYCLILIRITNWNCLIHMKIIPWITLSYITITMIYMMFGF